MPHRENCPFRDTFDILNFATQHQLLSEIWKIIIQLQNVSSVVCVCVTIPEIETNVRDEEIRNVEGASIYLKKTVGGLFR